MIASSPSFTVITHSIFSYSINFLLFYLFIGIVIYPRTKSLMFSLGYAVSNLIYSQILFYQTLTSTKLKGKKISSYFKRLSIYVIPIFIIALYVIIYRNSNPIFDGVIGDVFLNIRNTLNAIFQHIDLNFIYTFIICLAISTFIFFRGNNRSLIELDNSSKEERYRKKKKEHRNFKLTALKNEYKSGVFILLMLNALLLLLNVLDIKWVWFGFEWEGQYLKQFVHEGTYLLLLSIIISIIVVLYSFRKQYLISYLPKRKNLKY